MNTLEGLMDIGVTRSGAKTILNTNARHLGEIHGCNVITDITYIGNCKRDIELTCTKCGSVIHRTLSTIGFKWCDVKKRCERTHYVERSRYPDRPWGTGPMTSSPLYQTWNSIRKRCYNETDRAYKYYGKRGATICDEWIGHQGFDRFEQWAYENGFDPGKSQFLRRINKKGKYEPSNCRFYPVNRKAKS